VVGFVRFADVQSDAVHIRIDGHRGDAHLAASADDAHRDLSPVGNQDLLEHAAPPSILLVWHGRAHAGNQHEPAATAGAFSTKQKGPSAQCAGPSL